ncbi:MAG: hypothetical protein Q9204_007104 [Flavoplaca sp. TL-2023a]
MIDYEHLSHDGYLHHEMDEFISAIGSRAVRVNRSRALSRGKPFSKAEKEWVESEALFLDQKTLRDKDHGEVWISAILGGLSNLKHLSLSPANIKGPEEPDSPYGLPQIHNTLRAIGTLGTQLDSLCLTRVHWRLFDTDEELYELMKRAISSLKSLSLVVSTVEDDTRDPDSSSPACAMLFRTGRPLGFFRSMPHLQDFKISFTTWHDDADRVHLKDVVGQIRWPMLRHAFFNGLETGSEELLQFFQRHAKTLRAVRLFNMKLPLELWPRVLTYMRTYLDLEEFRLRYDFLYGWNYEGMQEYVLGKIDMSFDALMEACELLSDSEM